MQVLHPEKHQSQTGKRAAVRGVQVQLDNHGRTDRRDGKGQERAQREPQARPPEDAAVPAERLGVLHPRKSKNQVRASGEQQVAAAAGDPAHDESEQDAVRAGREERGFRGRLRRRRVR